MTTKDTIKKTQLSRLLYASGRRFWRRPMSTRQWGREMRRAGWRRVGDRWRHQGIGKNGATLYPEHARLYRAMGRTPAPF